jgi:hypothetical protein
MMLFQESPSKDIVVKPLSFIPDSKPKLQTNLPGSRSRSVESHSVFSIKIHVRWRRNEAKRTHLHS